MNILLNPGDHVIVLYPNYQSLYEIINAVPGCSYSRWNLHDGGDRLWLADQYDKAISIGGLSKSYGLAGLRVGWIAGKDAGVLKKIEKFKHYTSICDSAPSEFLAIIALRHSVVLMERNIEIIRKNMNYAHFFPKA